MRNIKELLQIVLASFHNDKKYHYGLCYRVILLRGHNTITEQETQLVLSYLDNNAPDHVKKLGDDILDALQYWWPKDEQGTENRINYLKSQIEKL